MAKEPTGKREFRLIREIAGINWRKSASVIVGVLFLSKSVRVGQQAIFPHTERDFRRKSEEFPCHSKEKIVMLRLQCFAIVVCLLSAISCKRVYSIRPIPAEDASIVDSQLIGMWTLTSTEKLDPKSATPNARFPFVMLIARSRTSDTTMEHLSFLIPEKRSDKKTKKKDGSDKIISFQGRIYFHHDKINTMCMEFRMPKNTDKIPEKEFWLDRYELKDENTLLLYALDFEHLKELVETNKFHGKYIPSETDGPLTAQDGRSKMKTKVEKTLNINDMIRMNSGMIILDDDPKKIIAYLEAHPEAFETNPWVYKRMNYGFVPQNQEEPESFEKSKVVPPVLLLPPPVKRKVESSKKRKVKQPIYSMDWISTFFLGLAAGVIFAIIAVLISRKRMRRIVT